MNSAFSSPRLVRVAFDVGGVLSKFPALFRPIFAALQSAPDVEVLVLTDMSDPAIVQQTLAANGFVLPIERIHCADFAAYGEACKAVLLEHLRVDVMIDDLPAYLASGCPVRLLLLPDVTRPYYHDSWQTPHHTGEFGRRLPHHLPDDEPR